MEIEAIETEKGEAQRQWMKEVMRSEGHAHALQSMRETLNKMHRHKSLANIRDPLNLTRYFYALLGLSQPPPHSGSERNYCVYVYEFLRCMYCIGYGHLERSIWLWTFSTCSAFVWALCM